MKQLEFENVTMDYGNDIEVVSNLSFSVNKGEIFTLLGASGSGKSTILRMIAGLETPTCGAIKIESQPVFDTSHNITSDKRKIGMVFQDYALFPHLSVYENIVFGLYGKTKEFKEKKAKELLETVNLQGFESRHPHELSGGQQQRVALARALANEPALLLMDEPFSNLDTSLREKMRIEIYNIIKKTGITAILVTHDQGEAMALSDRIAFLQDGMMAQIGFAHELYWKPVNSQTAAFMGKVNLIETYIDENSIDKQFSIPVKDIHSSSAILCIRPELIKVTKEGRLEGIVEYYSFVGTHQEVRIKYFLNMEESVFITAIAEPFEDIVKGLEIRFDINSNGIIAWPKE